MGCECLKMKNLDMEIITKNIEKDYISHKKENMRNTDTYFNSLKTSDNQQSKIENQNSNNYSNDINSKRKLDENISAKQKQIKNKNSKKSVNKKINLDINEIKLKRELNSNLNNNTINEKKQMDDFSQYIFNHINKIRENPQSFINNIEEAKPYILYNKSKKLIYKKNVKVALSEGIPAFQEAISILKICKPMNKLIFEPKLMVKLPDNEDDIIDKEYFKYEIRKMISEGIPIKSYWRDIINDPETSFLMMIVDDTGKKSGMKRNDILDPNMKYIGICSKSIGKYFICFLTFSDCSIN